MTAIKVTEHYKRVQRSRTKDKLEGLRTLTIAQVVLTPIAVGIGLFMNDPIMIGGAIVISGVCGLGSLYMMRRLEHHLEDL